MMKKFLFLFFLGGFIVLFSYWMSDYFGPASRESWLVANYLHFLGGIYAFFFMKSLYHLTEKFHKAIMAPWFEIIIFIGGALALGVIWEWYEFVFAYKYETSIMSQLSVTIYIDTIYDLMLDLGGATFAGAYLFIKNGKNK